MKQPSPQAAKRAAKNKKQAIVLLGLVAVLGVVLIIQFGGGGDDADTPPVAASSKPASAPTKSSTSTASKESASKESVAANDVLSKVDESGSKLTSNPFTNFLADLTSNDDEPEVQDLPRPNVKLTGTMPSESNSIAMIDSRIYRVGDVIQGWTIEEIEARSVILASPTKARITLSMPLLDPGTNK